MSVTILIFCFNVLVTYLCNVLFVHELSFGLMTLCVFGAVILEIALNAIVATVVCKCLPNKWFNHKYKFYNVPDWEIKLYSFLGVKMWKDKVLELGALNGFKKDKLAEKADKEYTEMFLLESNKGYVDHLCSIVCGFLILLLFIPNPLLMLTIGLPVAFTNIVINFMSLAILRFNTPRLKKLLELNIRREAVARKNAQKLQEKQQGQEELEIKTDSV